jgi:ParB family chromosome partitioning protein
MAKRRKLEAPNPDDMQRIEDEFRRETTPRPLSAPISQIAAESAQSATPESPAIRVERAKDKADAEALRAAQADGRLLLNLALKDIEPDAMVRDRTVLDAAEMEELKASIEANGLRLPIEVFTLPQKNNERQTYGLLSGYRRLRAVHALASDGKLPASIKAIIRTPDAMGGAFAAMVEENEVRASLSHFERGRIVVIAAQQGAFPSVTDAVNGLFPVASKAKRSKIRSFAVIFEELGDLLGFPESLKERDGLRLAAALRSGAQKPLRDVLATGQGVDALSEWAMLRDALDTFEAGPVTSVNKGGRPKSTPPAVGWKNADTLVLSSGVTLRKGRDSQGYTIRIEGAGVDSELLDSIMAELQFLLEKP